MASLEATILSQLKNLEHIRNCLEEHKAYDQQAAKLALQFQWDYVILHRICRQIISSYPLPTNPSANEQNLIRWGIPFLESVFKEAQTIESKLQFIETETELQQSNPDVRKLKYFEIKPLLEKWHRSLELQLIRLPESIPSGIVYQHSSEGTISTTEKLPDASTAKFVKVPLDVYPYLATQRNLHNFLSLSKPERLSKAQTLLSPNSMLEEDQRVSQKWMGNPDPRVNHTSPFCLKLSRDKTTIALVRKFWLLGWNAIAAGYETVMNDHMYRIIRMQVAKANCIEPGVPGILQCSQCLYDIGDKLLGNQNIIYHAPYELSDSGPISLRNLVQIFFTSVVPPLSQRINFAHELFTSIVFLHSVDLKHGELSSDSVISLEPKARFPNSRTGRPESLGQPYLGIVSQETTANVGRTFLWMPFCLRLEWEANIYRHPEKQDATEVPSSFEHDLYSIGVILLELGLWKILNKSDMLVRKYNLKKAHGLDMKEALLRIAREELLETAGEPYSHIVQLLLSYEPGAEIVHQSDRCPQEIFSEIDFGVDFQVTKEPLGGYLDYITNICNSLGSIVV